ncbi:MAG: hypothetical protein FJX75_13170 [Armatimonadetes bacterium]|nr:hypothetical protein [Armatimonadota bacterium]
MTEAEGWVTLGAGNRAVWPSDDSAPGGLALRDPIGRMRFLEALRSANARLPYAVEIGSVGQILRSAGYHTAIVGLREPWQLAAAMDAEGKVDLTTTHATPTALRDALAQADYVVVNAAAAGGDSQVADLIAAAAHALVSEDLLLVTGLAPRRSPFAGLAPIVARGPDYVLSFSQLVSPTTWRSGLVANIDLPPTILRHFGLRPPPSYANGSVIGISERLPLDLRAATELDGRGRRVNAFRNLVFPACLLLCAVLVPLAVVRRWPRRPSLRAGMMLALLFLPAASHLTAALPAAWSNAAWLAAILAAAALPGLIPLLTGRTGPRALAAYAVLAASFTMGLLIVDQSSGAPLQPIVPVGYALGFGGRFYGIGNEAAGVLMAAAAIAAALIGTLSRDTDAASRRIRLLAPVAIALAAVGVIAYPGLGANAGCTLASIICMGALLVIALPWRRKWLWAFVVLAVAAGALCLVAHFDAARPPDQMTHIGRAWHRLGAEGPSYLAGLARRKATTAWNTARLVPAMGPVSLWVLFWTYALLRPVGFVRRVFEAMPSVRPPLQAIAIAGLAATFLNDSGVTIPTVMFDFALPLLGLAALAQETETRPPEEAAPHA